MKCSHVRAILFEHPGAEIPAEVQGEVSAHLAQCPSCVVLFSDLEEQALALRTLPRLAPPEDLLGNIKSRLDRPSVLSIVKRRLRSLFERKHLFYLAGGAAAALLLILGVQPGLLRNTGRENSPSMAPMPEAPEAPKALEHARSHSGLAKSFEPGASSVPVAPPRSRPGVLALVLNLPEARALDATPREPLARRSLSDRAVPPPPGAAGRGGNAERMVAQSSRQGLAHPAPALRAASGPRSRGVFEDLTRLVSRANGRVLNRSQSLREDRPGTLLVEIPRAFFPTFLTGMRKLGEVEFDGPEESPARPDAKVRVSIRLVRK